MGLREEHDIMQWKMEFESNYYQSPDLKRTLKEMIVLSQKKNAKEKHCCEHTSLLSSDKKKLLKDLPCKLPSAIQPETASTIQRLWETFHEIFSIVTNKPHQRMIWIATLKKQRVG